MFCVGKYHSADARREERRKHDFREMIHPLIVGDQESRSGPKDESGFLHQYLTFSTNEQLQESQK